MQKLLFPDIETAPNITLSDNASCCETIWEPTPHIIFQHRMHSHAGAWERVRNGHSYREIRQTKSLIQFHRSSKLIRKSNKATNLICRTYLFHNWAIGSVIEKAPIPDLPFE